MRRLNDWLKGYIQYTQYSEAPDHYHFWTGVSVIAGALRRKVWLDMQYFEWTPNFYIILVAPPGILNKSTTIGIGRSLLRQIQGVKFGPSALTWQALINELRSAGELVLMPDTQYHPMACLNFFVSELGTLLDPQDRQMVDILVDLWDGQKGAWEKATKMFGMETVVSPWINVLAGVTPKWLAANLPRTMIGGGFTSRCIFVLGNRKRQLVPYPHRCASPEWIKKIQEDLLVDLEYISMLKGSFTLTEEAYAYGVKWYQALYGQLLQHTKAHSDFGGYLARKQSHLHKLAMIISASRRDTLEITEDDLSFSAQILRDLEADLPEIFKSITTTESMESAEKLVEIVQSKQKIRFTDLYRMFFHNLDFQHFRQLVESAINAGYITQKQYGNTVFIEVMGKPAGTPVSTQSTSAAAAVPTPAGSDPSLDP